jgi:peptidoglycan/xylan/chitin deacetylase (PgdA/CDA1 family)
VACQVQRAIFPYDHTNLTGIDRTMHSRLKQPLERALGSPGVTWITRRRLRGKRLVLAYHGIIPEGASQAGERALFISQRDFAAQLDMLCEVADVASLTNLDEEGDGRPRVAITIDDAYAGIVDEGVHELVLRSLPATIFVAPGRLDGHTFWWDALSHPAGKLDSRVRDYALYSLAGRDERVREWAMRTGLPVTTKIPEYARSANTDKLRAAVDHPGITVASHTWSHANLASLSAPEIVSELERSRSWVKAEFPGKAIDWLAYPYGLDSSAVHRAAAACSYTGGLRIMGGWHNIPIGSLYARPRLNVSSSLSLAGLRARVLGAVRLGAGTR